MATKKAKIETIEAEHGLAENLAKQINAKFATASQPTKDKLQALLGNVGEAAGNPKLLKEEEAHAVAGIKKLKNEIMHDKIPNEMRKEVHDMIFKVLSPTVTSGSEKFDFTEDVEAMTPKLTSSDAATEKPDSAHPKPKEKEGRAEHAEEKKPKAKPGHHHEEHGDEEHHGDDKHNSDDHDKKEHSTEPLALTPGRTAAGAVLIGATAAGVAAVSGGINGASSVGFLKGAADVLTTTIPGFLSSTATSIWGGLQAFTTALGFNTGSLATSSTAALAPAFVAPALAGVGLVLASGRALRGIRRLLIIAGRGDQKSLPELGVNPLKGGTWGRNLMAPITESLGLLSDITSMIFGRKDDKGENGGLVPTLWGYTGAPVLNQTQKIIVPTKASFSPAAGAAALGTLFGGPALGLGAYALVNRWLRRNESADGKPAAAAAPAHPPDGHH